MTNAEAAKHFASLPPDEQAKILILNEALSFFTVRFEVFAGRALGIVDVSRERAWSTSRTS